MWLQNPDKSCLHFHEVLITLFQIVLRQANSHGDHSILLNACTLDPIPRRHRSLFVEDMLDWSRSCIDESHDGCDDGDLEKHFEARPYGHSFPEIQGTSSSLSPGLHSTLQGCRSQKLPSCPRHWFRHPTCIGKEATSRAGQQQPARAPETAGRRCRNQEVNLEGRVQACLYEAGVPHGQSTQAMLICNSQEV